MTGLRRVGKTSLMKLSIQHLLEKGIKPKNIFSISVWMIMFSRIAQSMK
ncbi:MAG: hypothetical protein IPO06_25665 [Leptospiraceae bacterium]|nr:hypothetical protein [Leptospiraceae bacterium]